MTITCPYCNHQFQDDYYFAWHVPCPDRAGDVSPAVRKLAAYAVSCSLRARYEDIARGAIERQLDTDEHDSPDSIYSEAFTIAHKALCGAGADPADASELAEEAARNVAQP